GDFVADVEHVFDLVDPAVFDFADVNHAVLVHAELHDGARFKNARYNTGNHFAFFDFANDVVDHADSLVGGGAAGGRDIDRAVVLDFDFGAGLLLDGADDLAAAADHVADAFDRNLQ